MHRKWKFSSTWVEPKTKIQKWELKESTPKIAHWGPKNPKDLKIKSISNVRIEENIENKSCYTGWVNPKMIFEPKSNPRLLLKKPKTTIKLGQN